MDITKLHYENQICNELEVSIYITEIISIRQGGKVEGCESEREEKYFGNKKNQKKLGVKNIKGVKSISHVYINTLGRLGLF